MYKIVLKIFLFIFLIRPHIGLGQEVLDILNQLPDIKAKETTTIEDTDKGLKRFVIEILQPVDHFNPTAGTFSQKLILFHRGFSEPMTLQTSGYAIFGEGLSNLASTFLTNQLQVEHRYFAGSIPTSPDWSKLTVRQSAEDFHHIVQVFKKLYTKKWINTGASKGGMTSIYHRRFYPEDLDGTIAYVAPLSFSTNDLRYPAFLETVGGSKYADCRLKLEELQKLSLMQRKNLLPMIEGEFTRVGSKEVAFESAIIGYQFSFWQYTDPEDKEIGCEKIPGPNASTTELYDYLLYEISDLRDSSINNFQAYYYQSEAELGGPASKTSHLKTLLEHDKDEPYSLLPIGVSVTYSDSAMKDVKDWVAKESQGIIFVYGEFDPWTAGAYVDINKDADNYNYVVPNANHLAGFSGLSEDLRAEALATLSRWFNKPLPLKSLNKKYKSKNDDLEEIEYKVRKKLKL